MTFQKTVIIFAALAIAVIGPLPSFSEVKVLLKNGRSVSADSCQEIDGRFACSRMGGIFYLEKQEITEIKGITTERKSPPDNRPEQPVSTPEEQDRKAEGKSERIKAGGEAGTKSTIAGAEKRLEQIRQRKLELNEEREKLLKERQRLQEDFKKASDWMPVDQHDIMSKQNAGIEERINRFNGEVKALDQEEKKLLEGLKGKGE